MGTFELWVIFAYWVTFDFISKYELWVNFFFWGGGQTSTHIDTSIPELGLALTQICYMATIIVYLHLVKTFKNIARSQNAALRKSHRLPSCLNNYFKVLYKKNLVLSQFEFLSLVTI